MQFKWLIIILLILSQDAIAKSAVTVYTEIFPPYQIETKTGEVAGWSTTFVEEVFKKANIDMKINVLPWSRAYKLVQEQPNSFIYSLMKIPAREALFHWVFPLCKIELSFYKSKRRVDISIAHEDDAKKWRVGVERGQANFTYLIEQGFSEANNLIVVNHNDQLRDMLLRDRVDLILVSEHYVVQLQQANVENAVSLEKLFSVEALSRTLFLAANLATDPQVIIQLQQAYQNLAQNQFNATCPI
jgi:polar amino acid transport system substrate-binding protein